MARIVVSGGAGYVGCWACLKLTEAGHSVVCIDSGFFPSGWNYVASLPNVEMVQADVRGFDLGSLGGFDAVVHLAGLSNDPAAAFNPSANHQMNTVATGAFVQQAVEAECKRFIFASSASVYGVNPMPKLTEDTPLKPLSYYAESKARAEEFVLGAADRIGGVVLRQGTLMGWSPRHRNDLVVNTMVKKALDTGRIMVNAGGEAARPLLDVRDVAEAYVRLLDAPDEAVSGQVFNIAHRRAGENPFEGYTVACLALWIKHLLEENHGVKAEIVGNWQDSECRSYDMSSEKLRGVLGWEPGLGVSAAVDSIMEHRGELGRYDQVNIEWMKALEHGQMVTRATGGVFELD